MRCKLREGGGCSHSLVFYDLGEGPPRPHTSLEMTFAYTYMFRFGPPALLCLMAFSNFPFCD